MNATLTTLCSVMPVKRKNGNRLEEERPLRVFFYILFLGVLAGFTGSGAFMN